mmetsp:Transcript_90818/g.282486  ORF Transcript_90818/g.282486 Transcript_90818/m.282486 type:complete len:235 (+) Transcript_90818:230-934(+)
MPPGVVGLGPSVLVAALTSVRLRRFEEDTRSSSRASPQTERFSPSRGWSGAPGEPGAATRASQSALRRPRALRAAQLLSGLLGSLPGACRPPRTLALCSKASRSPGGCTCCHAVVTSARGSLPPAQRSSQLAGASLARVPPQPPVPGTLAAAERPEQLSLCRPPQSSRSWQRKTEAPDCSARSAAVTSSVCCRASASSLRRAPSNDAPELRRSCASRKSQLICAISASWPESWA